MNDSFSLSFSLSQQINGNVYLPLIQGIISVLKLGNLVIHNSNYLEGILEYLCRLFIPKPWDIMVNKSHYLASLIQRLEIYFICLYQPLFTKRLMVFPDSPVKSFCSFCLHQHYDFICVTAETHQANSFLCSCNTF